MQSISLCMIVRSEPELLRNCLASAREICQQIVTVVDDDPDPGVVEVCEEFGAEVHHRSMNGHFGDQRNESFSHATGDWILWLDSDDVLPQRTAMGIRMAVEDPRAVNVDAFLLPYHYSHDERGRPSTILVRERVLRRSVGWEWRYPIHEVCMTPDGRNPRAARLDVPVVHRRVHDVGRRNMEIIDRWLEDYSDDGRMLFYAGNEYLAAGRMGEAEDCYRRCLQTERWSEHLALAAVRLSAICARDRRLDEAASLALQAIGHEPLRLEGYILLGDISTLVKDRRRAEHWYGIAASMQEPPCLMPHDPRLSEHARRRLYAIRQPGDILADDAHRDTTGRDNAELAARRMVSFG